jgi:hypothetical protein
MACMQWKGNINMEKQASHLYNTSMHTMCPDRVSSKWVITLNILNTYNRQVSVYYLRHLGNRTSNLVHVGMDNNKQSTHMMNKKTNLSYWCFICLMFQQIFEKNPQNISIYYYNIKKRLGIQKSNLVHVGLHRHKEKASAA